jgi:ankyrin repeat protein
MLRRSSVLARGANPNSPERLGQTALMWAAAEGHTAVVRALIEAGADLNARLDSGFTPFFFAVRGGHLAAVREFLAAGIDVNAMMSLPGGQASGQSRCFRRLTAPANSRSRCSMRA